MAQARVTGVIHVMGRDDMQPRRQRPDPQPIAAMDDRGTLLIGADDVAAGIAASVELARGMVDSRRGGRTAKQLPRQQSTAPGLGWRRRFWPVGDGDQ